MRPPDPATESSGLRVVLVEPRNPLNIGAAARAMSNFGFLKLRLVNPYHVAYREARSAVNAHALLAASREYPTVAEAVADCSLVVGTTAVGHRELQHPLRRLETGGRIMRQNLNAGASVALLFGSEKFGLGNEDMSHCHWLMRIPTREEHSSMNLGQAVALCLYELIRSPAAAKARPESKRPAGAGEMERVTEALLAVLRRSGYVHPRVESSTDMKIRRLVRRMHLAEHDAVVWLGMLRQMLWKIEQ
ncbi:MAG: TrmJ/YjtD family RNA methyltransferase [Bryobacteraceae bacterium]